MSRPQLTMGTLLVCGSTLTTQIDLPLMDDEKARLTFLQEIVGGFIETVPLPEGRYLVFAADEKLDLHFVNTLATALAHASESIMPDDYVAGTAIVIPQAFLQ